MPGQFTHPLVDIFGQPVQIRLILHPFNPVLLAEDFDRTGMGCCIAGFLHLFSPVWLESIPSSSSKIFSILVFIKVLSCFNRSRLCSDWARFLLTVCNWSSKTVFSCFSFLIASISRLTRLDNRSNFSNAMAYPTGDSFPAFSANSSTVFASWG